jgi:hypothetical protein
MVKISVAGAGVPGGGALTEASTTAMDPFNGEPEAMVLTAPAGVTYNSEFASLLATT